jgi:hypothetical protein
VLIEEIRIKKEIIEMLQDENDELKERIHQMEWAMGI